MRAGVSNGFSLVECLAVLVVATVLVSTAAPSFSDARAEAALTASANQLLGALHFARSAAILSNTPTVLCLSADGVGCADGIAGEPIQGWLVFRNDEHEPLQNLNQSNGLLRQADLPESVSIVASREALTFWPMTRAGTTGTFTFCSRRAPTKARKVVVSQTGRPRVAEPADAAGCAS